MDENLNIKQKLLLIQGELKAPKNQLNSHGGFKYRSCEDILEAAKPLCAKYGVLPLLSDDIVSVGGFNYVKATAAIIDVLATVGDPNGTVSAVAYAKEPTEHKGKDDSQATGAASSYARKYALNALFAIDDTKDADSDESPQEAPQRRTAPQRTQDRQQADKPTAKPAQSENKPLTLKEAMQEEVDIKGTSYRLGALRDDQLEWIINHFDGRTKEAAQLIRREKYKSALEDEQGEIPFD